MGVLNSFLFLHAIVLAPREIPPVSSGKSCLVVGFELGPGPVLLLFRCWFLWRNANLAGGFAGRLVSWFLCVRGCWVLICHLFSVQLEPLSFWRRVLIRSSAYIPITGPSLRATSAKPEEKKSFPRPSGLVITLVMNTACLLAPLCPSGIGHRLFSMISAALEPFMSL